MSAWGHATSFSVLGVGVCNMSTGGEDEKTREGAKKHTRKIRIDTGKVDSASWRYCLRGPVLTFASDL